MTSIIDDGDLQLMAEFDFKYPVTTTVLICDSDEELNASTPVEGSKRDTTEELDRMVSKIFEDLIRETDATTNEKQISPEGNPSQGILSSSPSDNIVCKSFEHTVQVTNKTGQGENAVYSAENNVNNKNRSLFLASKQCDNEGSQQSGAALSNSTMFFASNVIQSQNDLVQSQSRKRRGKRLASDPNKRKNSKKETTSNVSVYQNIETTPNVYTQAGSNQIIFTREEEQSNLHNMRIVPQVHDGVQPYFPTERVSSQSQNHFTVGKCIRKLLETVSTHMVLIVKAHIEYVTTKETSNGYVVEIAKKRFIETKTHLFYLSLSIVTNIILPRENDNVFVETIITDAVRIAYLKNLFVRRSDMKMLFDEMCNWVRSHTFKNSIITELLNKSPEPNKANTTSSNTIQYQSMPNNYAGDDLNNMNRTIAQPPTPNTNMGINYCNSQPTMQPSNLIQANTTHPPTYPAQTYSLVPPPYHQTYKTYGTTYTQQRHSVYQLANSTQDQRFVSEQEHVETNRSLSRDSGVQSPVDLLPTDAMSSSTRNDQMDAHVTPAPLITHVTSLNPSVLLIKDGVCHVCGTLTKHKCLGCYKCYYCSYQCQAADWKNHELICKYKIR